MWLGIDRVRHKSWISFWETAILNIINTNLFLSSILLLMIAVDELFTWKWRIKSPRNRWWVPFSLCIAMDAISKAELIYEIKRWNLINILNVLRLNNCSVHTKFSKLCFCQTVTEVWIYRNSRYSARLTLSRKYGAGYRCMVKLSLVAVKCGVCNDDGIVMMMSAELQIISRRDTLLIAISFESASSESPYTTIHLPTWYSQMVVA